MSHRALPCAACLVLAAAPAMAQTVTSATSADWILEGNAAYVHLGISAAPAGDVNGDGYDDVLIATSREIGLYEGSAAGLATLPSWSFGPAGSGDFLRAFPLGDANGDGYDDVLIGDPGFDAPLRGGGRVLLFLGSAAGLPAGPAWSLEGDRAGAGLGQFAGGGDVDGDGLGDAVVAEFNRIRVFRGMAPGLDPSPAWTILSPDASVLFAGYHSNLLAVQDLDADGFADVATTTIEFHGNWPSGHLLVYAGSAQGPRLDRQINLDYSKGDLLATAYSAGDVNGDGRGDLVVPYYGGHGSVPEPGESDPESILVFEGSPKGVKPGSRILIEGLPSTALEQTGSAGDLDGDGFGDLIVAESFVPISGQEYHRVSLFRGDRHGPSAPAAVIIVPDQPGDLAPFWAATGRAGDVNGDGYGDVIVGVPGFSGPETEEGRVYVFHGGPEL